MNTEKTFLAFGFKKKLKKKPTESLFHRITTRFRLPDFSKRQKFIIDVLILSSGLFLSEYFFSQYGIFMAIFLAVLTDLLLFVSNHNDIKGNLSPRLFILPFLYSLAFGLFYFLIPARLLTKIAMTLVYGAGLYSVFLSQNIFVVASMRTIALLSSARTVSFIMTIVAYFFLANITFTLDLPLLPTAGIVFLFSYLLVNHSVWSYTLEKPFFSQSLWVFSLALCLCETSMLLWFWPSSPTVIALFLTGLFYALVGLSHVWFDKRLFRSVLWEYIWVAVAVLCILILFTSWKG